MLTVMTKGGPLMWFILISAILAACAIERGGAS